MTESFLCALSKLNGWSLLDSGERRVRNGTLLRIYATKGPEGEDLSQEPDPNAVADVLANQRRAISRISMSMGFYFESLCGGAITG